MVTELREKEGKMPDCVGPNDFGDDKRCENNAGGWPVIEAGEPWRDWDKDGVPDDWENQHGTDPSFADALEDHDGDGYTNVENWAHSIR